MNRDIHLNSRKEKEFENKIESLSIENHRISEKYKILKQHYETETQKNEQLKNAIRKYQENSKKEENLPENKYIQRLKRQIQNVCFFPLLFYLLPVASSFFFFYVVVFVCCVL